MEKLVQHVLAACHRSEENGGCCTLIKQDDVDQQSTDDDKRAAEQPIGDPGQRSTRRDGQSTDAHPLLLMVVIMVMLVLGRDGEGALVDLVAGNEACLVE